MRRASSPLRGVSAVVAALAMSFGWLLFVSAARANCEIRGVATHTGHVTDVLATPNSLWVASHGGLQEYDRTTRRLVRTYTTLDGLSSLRVHQLSRISGGSIVATLGDAMCTLRGSRFSCSKKTKAPPVTRMEFHFAHGRRVTTELELAEGLLQGTASDGAWLGDKPLARGPGLPGPHVTSLAVFRNELWVGTFNRGLARGRSGAELSAFAGPGKFINALLSTKRSLFVGTSQGLFRTHDGRAFQRIELVEDAVVGLATDGTSVWVSTPGALYRINDGAGPPSDVWWIPGGSRSLQKVSARPGAIWIGTEDRGAILMTPGPRTTAKDKPFFVFDKTSGMPSSWSLAAAPLPSGGALVTTLREGTQLLDPGGAHRPLALPVGDWGLSALVETDDAWVGTQDGAAHVDLITERSERIGRLPDERVHAFLRDPRDPKRLYIGTENGLAWCETPR